MYEEHFSFPFFFFKKLKIAQGQNKVLKNVYKTIRQYKILIERKENKSSTNFEASLHLYCICIESKYLEYLESLLITLFLPIARLSTLVNRIFKAKTISLFFYLKENPKFWSYCFPLAVNTPSLEHPRGGAKYKSKFYKF